MLFPFYCFSLFCIAKPWKRELWPLYLHSKRLSLIFRTTKALHIPFQVSHIDCSHCPKGNCMLGYCTQALHTYKLCPFIKVQVFWKGNKNWKNKSYFFWIYKWDIFSFLVAFSHYLNFRNHSDPEYKTA